MPLNRRLSEIWQAMEIGPQWILRSSADPLRTPTKETSPAASTPVPRMASSVVSEQAQPFRRSALFVASRGKAALLSPGRARGVARGLGQSSPITFGVRADPELAKKIAHAKWEDLAELARSCYACEMAATRVQPVLADGAPGCPLVIVGEAPGRDEDLQGLPFVGKSGQLLDNILKALDLKRRQDVAIINVLKCRPPQNRDPLPEEVAACKPFLERQLTLLAPKVLILMGRHAVHTLLNMQTAIGKLRGTTYQVRINGVEVPTVVTYHPSYLLRNPVEKDKSWKDMLMARALLRAAQASSACPKATE